MNLQTSFSEEIILELSIWAPAGLAFAASAQTNALDFKLPKEMILTFTNRQGEVFNAVKVVKVFDRRHSVHIPQGRRRRKSFVC